jgi:hypothetical protein
MAVLQEMLGTGWPAPDRPLSFRVRRFQFFSAAFRVALPGDTSRLSLMFVSTNEIRRHGNATRKAALKNGKLRTRKL